MERLSVPTYHHVESFSARGGRHIYFESFWDKPQDGSIKTSAGLFRFSQIATLAVGVTEKC